MTPLSNIDDMIQLQVNQGDRLVRSAANSVRVNYERGPGTTGPRWARSVGPEEIWIMVIIYWYHAWDSGGLK